jgi:hypothetical protein
MHFIEGTALSVTSFTIAELFNDEQNKIIIVVLAKHEIAPWKWFLRQPKHVGAIVGILIILIFLRFYNCVPQLEGKRVF